MRDASCTLRVHAMEMQELSADDLFRDTLHGLREIVVRVPVQFRSTYFDQRIIGMRSDLRQVERIV